jgi:dTDP-4-amino-4,6-dideoxygalactose transaminase
MQSLTEKVMTDKDVAPAAKVNREPAKKPLFPFLDLQSQFKTMREEVITAVTRVLDSQHFILGPEVAAFEQEIKNDIGAEFAISCASGSDALLLALMAIDAGPGDEVITTPFTFVATAGSIARMGSKPVFVDIDPETFNIDPSQIEAAITSKTRAIMPVHLFGLSADLDPIIKMAKQRNLAVIEDAAQAIGAQYKGRPVGGLGTFGCFSFFPSKNLGGAGDGGMIGTNDPALADRLTLLRTHGSRTKYEYELLGMNSRLDALQAAILRVKFRHLSAWTSGRQGRAERYRKLFHQAGLDRQVKLPVAGADYVHVYNQFVIRAEKRDQLRAHLQRSGIPTDIYYPKPLHVQPAFAYLGYKPGAFPQSESISNEVLALPVYGELKDEHQDAVVAAIAEFYGSKV